MSERWHRLCPGKDLEIDGNKILVRFQGGRAQKVTVVSGENEYRLLSIVMRHRLIADEEQLALDAWSRNRSTRLVGFRIDARGHLVGESWVPMAGLTSDEFTLYVRTIAAECDRFEYLLTGRDME